MKRAAEKQLSRNDEGPDELDSAIQGFKKADDAALAARPIRALPRRAQPGAPSPAEQMTNDNESKTTSKFAGFAGFGTPASSSTSFSFTPPTSSTSPLSSLTIPTPSPAVVASSASSATKTFASLISTPVSSSPAPVSPGQPPEDASALKYYCSIRGLNHSFLTSVTAAIQKDPFVDIAQTLDFYKSTRRDIQKEFDDRKPAAMAPSKPQGFGSSSNSAQPPPSMPKPPSAFAGFAASAPKSETTTDKPPVLTPTTASTYPSSLFGFSKPTSNPFSFPDSSKSTTASPSTLTFGAPAGSPSPFAPPEPAKQTPAFSNVSPPSASKPHSAFSFSPPSDSTKPTKDASNPFGVSASSMFGSTSAFGVRTGADSPFARFGTGASATTATAAAAPASSSGGASASGSAFGAFGKPLGGSSTGSAVGFGFASSAPKTPDAELSSAAHTDDDKSTGSAAPEEEDGPPKMLLSGTVHDDDGEGEEEEETLHQVRSKVYKLTKKDGAPKWVDQGIGLLKVKKHKTTGNRRALLRNSSTGKITLNFNLYSGLTPTLAKTFVSFVGHEADGTPATFKIKVKTEEEGQALVDVLERESKRDDASGK